jgi:hypothetical protein
MMKLKGVWSADVSYSIGDVVKNEEDGVVYILQYAAPAGANPKDTRYWGKVDQRTGDAVCLILDGLDLVKASIPTNISDDAIILKGSGDDEYLITVDDSGETPELDVSPLDDSDETPEQDASPAEDGD